MSIYVRTYTFPDGRIQIVDVCKQDPSTCFTPNIAAEFVISEEENLYPGSIYENGSWTHPESIINPPEIPIEVSAYQIRAALNHYDLRTLFETAIAASTDMNLKDAWEYKTEIHSDNQSVIALCEALNISKETRLEVFSYAKTLT